MNDRGDCRTAPATPGLLNTRCHFKAMFMILAGVDLTHYRCNDVGVEIVHLEKGCTLGRVKNIL